VVSHKTAQEFKGLQSVKTHDLEILLRLSGVEPRVKSKYLAEWSAVADWDPEKRYQTTGQFTLQEANAMIAATEKLMSAL
jgi:hypothetical protein